MTSSELIEFGNEGRSKTFVI